MAYDFQWRDENRRIFEIKAFDPMTEGEARELIAKLRAITEVDVPFYLLLDFQEFDLMKAMTMRNIITNEPMPRHKKALENSRIAVVGGGQLVTMGLQFIQGMTSLDLMRAFSDEAAGLRWLEDEARLAGVV